MRNREGWEYVVCDECGSHVLLLERDGWTPTQDEVGVATQLVGFTCDNDECAADFTAEVHLKDAPHDPCVGSGMCCKKHPCFYGEPDETGGCRFLIVWEGDDLPVERYRCGKHAEIVGQPGAAFEPVFGA